VLLRVFNNDIAVRTDPPFAPGSGSDERSTHFNKQEFAALLVRHSEKELTHQTRPAWVRSCGLTRDRIRRFRPGL